MLVFELSRSAGLSMTSTQLAVLARQYVDLGADALVVNTDSEATPEGF